MLRRINIDEINQVECVPNVIYYQDFSADVFNTMIKWVNPSIIATGERGFVQLQKSDTHSYFKSTDILWYCQDFDDRSKFPERSNDGGLLKSYTYYFLDEDYNLMGELIKHEEK